MTAPALDGIWHSLTCSHCGGKLKKSAGGAECLRCGLHYDYAPSGSLDLRLKKPKKCNLEFDLGTSLPSDNEFQVEPLIASSVPEVDFSHVRVPWHLTREMLSHFPRAKSPDSLVLDLGCGEAIHKEVCEHAGFQWVGVDHHSTKAMILGDAHALPFENDTFDFILSIAVLEHIRFPFVMIREAYRVLKPHGKFIGTVAFLEPFHGDSYYHHTHLGIFNSLHYGGFSIVKLAPSVQWSGLRAQASMGLFPKMPWFMSRAIVYPIQVLHKLWWRVGRLIKPHTNKHLRITKTTGSFTFIATKGSA